MELKPKAPLFLGVPVGINVRGGASYLCKTSDVATTLAVRLQNTATRNSDVRRRTCSPASSPGMTEMVLSARSTLKVLNADTLPRSTNSVTYLQQAGDRRTKTHTEGLTTLRSNQRHTEMKPGGDLDL